MFSAQPSLRPVPAFAPSRGGDDLQAARRFVESAVDQMRTLRIDDREEISLWLDAVDAAARPLQARAIARAVAECRSVLHTDAIANSIGSVATLIAQYEQGLVDVEAQLEAGEIIAPDEPELALPDVSREDRFEEARRTLAALLPTIDTAPHTDALNRLVAFRPNNTDASVTPIDVAAELTLDLDRDLVIDAVEDTAPMTHPRPLNDFAFDIEALMPGLVDHAHRMARMHGKSLTASYACREARLDPSMATDWQEAVETAISALVDTTLDTSAARRARGETSAAHMSMTAQGTAEGVELLITCPGSVRPRFSVDAPHGLDMRVDDGHLMLRFIARAQVRGVA